MLIRSTAATSIPCSRREFDLHGVVGEQAHRPGAEIREDRGPGGILAGVDRQAELDLGVDGVEPLVLQRVGLQLGDQPHPAALVAPQVDDDATLGSDPLEGTLQLRPAVTALRAEHVPREALGVEAHQGALVPSAPGTDQREVLGHR